MPREVLAIYERESRGFRFIWASVRTLVQLLVAPRSTMASVAGKEDIRKTLLFVLCLAAPSWCFALFEAHRQLFVHGLVRQAYEDPRVLDASMGAPFVDALALWQLWMMPFSLVAYVFLGGLIAHICMVLTGPVRQSMGRSIRLFALAGALHIFGAGVVFAAHALPFNTPQVQLLAILVLTLLAFVWLVMGMQQQQAIGWLRATLVGLLPAGWMLAASLFLPVLHWSAWPGEVTHNTEVIFDLPSPLTTAPSP